MKTPKPAGSRRRARSERDSATWRRVIAIAAIPTGRLTRKIQRQPSPLVSRPPRTGPSATLMPVTAPQTPKAVPRSRPWNVWARSASEVANMIAPPTPWAAREAISIVGDWARPQSTEPAVKTTKPVAKRRRRPKRSASDPVGSISAASESEYASIVHWTSEKLAPSEVWMSGRATITIVTSSRSMKVPRQTATSVHQACGFGFEFMART